MLFILMYVRYKVVTMGSVIQLTLQRPTLQGCLQLGTSNAKTTNGLLFSGLLVKGSGGMGEGLKNLYDGIR